MQDEMLLKAIKGDPASITKIIEQYTPLVHKIVNKYSWMSPSHSREDLVQEGLLGVVKAIETFDMNRGNAFMSWVYPQVRGAVQNLARKEHRIPVPLEFGEGASFNASYKVEAEGSYILKYDLDMDKIRDIVINCCGSVDSKRAQIVCSRYGLLGQKAMRQGEVAKKFGMTKQAINSHIARFVKIARKKYPHLQELIK